MKTNAPAGCDRAELAAAVVLRPELDDLPVEQDVHRRRHHDLVLE
jgi:hypothetical protein